MVKDGTNARFRRAPMARRAKQGARLECFQKAFWRGVKPGEGVPTGKVFEVLVGRAAGRDRRPYVPAGPGSHLHEMIRPARWP